ncbi:hypothetical protein F1C10_07625 [Sphingomonas sp. NBWT7]|uniref:pilus assembly protein TadG-related protein n=1 Tax=Sphingomonas sp. NBWT7 TaxID=2596913 RepID=UPI0016255E8F|nr:pilus assembly protein TadG-related protein [Sphingomonas sp. NBWT7]QNE31816.1 hypothetical protein F1C10_07625 [Sphingomonas sp. NBWT7]
MGLASVVRFRPVSGVRRLSRDRRGGVGLMVAGMMPVLVGFAAFAIDVGAVQLETRRLQGIADAAAMAAASTTSGATQRAQAIVDGSGWQHDVAVRVEQGAYSADPAKAPSARFVANASGADAARVTLESVVPTFFARVFGTREVSIARSATARRQRFAAFSIGSRLASVDAGLLNAYLGALTGSDIRLTAMDYDALANAQVDLFALLPLVRSSAALDAVTFRDILTSQVATPKLLDALAHALTGSNQTSAAAAVRQIATVAGGASVSLGALIDAGPLGGQAGGGTGVARVDAMALATAILQLAGPRRQVAIDLGASIPGLASTRLMLAIGERAQQSPWIAITDTGTPIVRTAQARAYLETRLSPMALPGLGSLVSINLPVLVELASAEGRLAAIDCAAGAGRGVTLEGRTDIGSAAIGTIETGRLDDFATALMPARAALVDTLLIDVIGSSRMSLGAAEPWRSLRFSESEIATRARKTVASSQPLGGIVSSLIGQASLSVQVIGLAIPIDPLLRGVGAALTPIAPALDRLLMTATGTLGVGLGEADLSVTGMRCGQAILVA